MIPSLPCRNQSGNVAVFFALAIIPIVGVVGLSMDYEATVNSKTKVQSVVDTAILAASKHYQAGGDKNATESFAQSMIKDQLDQYNADLDCADASVTVGDDENTLSITIDCDHDTSLMGVLGFSEMDFTVASNSRWNYDKLEVAFVFDLSRSMETGTVSTGETYVEILKSAAQGALDVFLPASGSPPVANTRIAMLTYAEYFNAGDLFPGATGMQAVRKYQAEDHYEDSSGTPRKQTLEREFNNTCVIERFGKHAFTDVAPDPSPPSETEVLVTPVDTVEDSRKSVSEPWGIYPDLMDLPQTVDNPHGFVSAPYYLLRDRETIQQSSLQGPFPTRHCPYETPIPLTNDRNTLVNYINSLDPINTGNGTGTHLGMAWGWYLLSENWKHILPATAEPAPYSDANTLKAIILMTDGMVRVDNFGQGDGQPQLETLCQNIKDMTNIRIYTIGLAGGAGLDVVKDCATSSEHTFDAYTAAELASAYSEIAKDLIDLRLTS